MDEETFMMILAFPRQLYDNDLASRLKKHQVFPVMLTTSGNIHEDCAKAYRTGTSFGLYMEECKFEMVIKGMNEVVKKQKSRIEEVFVDGCRQQWSRLRSLGLY